MALIKEHKREKQARERRKYNFKGPILMIGLFYFMNYNFVMFKRYLKLFLAISSKFIPQFIVKSLYLLIFYSLKKYFKYYGLDIGYRNGLYDGHIVLGLSDIDINIFLTENLDSGSSHMITKVYRRAKLIAPILGEYNLIVLSNYKSFSIFANSYVLNRDPFFVSQKNNFTDSQKITFLLKLLRANSNHLAYFSSHITNKWINYFSQVSLRADNITDQASIIDQIHKNFGHYLDDDLVIHLKNFAPKNDFEINQYYETEPNKIPMMTVSTVQWLGAAILNDSTENDIYSISSKKYHLELFLANIDWEIWGIYTQLLEHRPNQLISHLENIIIVLNQIKSCKNINIDMNQRISALESINDQVNLLL